MQLRITLDRKRGRMILTTISLQKRTLITMLAAAAAAAGARRRGACMPELGLLKA